MRYTVVVSIKAITRSDFIWLCSTEPKHVKLGGNVFLDLKDLCSSYEMFMISINVLVKVVLLGSRTWYTTMTRSKFIWLCSAEPKHVKLGRNVSLDLKDLCSSYEVFISSINVLVKIVLLGRRNGYTIMTRSNIWLCSAEPKHIKLGSNVSLDLKDLCSSLEMFMSSINVLVRIVLLGRPTRYTTMTRSKFIWLCSAEPKHVKLGRNASVGLKHLCSS